MNQRTCQGNTLALTPGEYRAILSYVGLVAHWHCHDVVVNLCCLRRLYDLLYSDACIAQGDVFSYRPTKEAAILDHRPELRTHRLIIERLKRKTIVIDTATCRLVEAEQ